MSYDWKTPKNHWIRDVDLYSEVRLKFDFNQIMRKSKVLFDDFDREFLKQRRPQTILLTKEFWEEKSLPRKLN